MVCSQSGVDDHPALKRDPHTDPRPERKAAALVRVAGVDCKNEITKRNSILRIGLTEAGRLGDPPTEMASTIRTVAKWSESAGTDKGQAGDMKRPRPRTRSEISSSIHARELVWLDEIRRGYSIKGM